MLFYAIQACETVGFSRRHIDHVYGFNSLIILLAFSALMILLAEGLVYFIAILLRRKVKYTVLYIL